MSPAGALTKGGFAATIVVIVELCLIGAKQIVVSHTFDLTNDNLWKMPIGALVAAPVLAFCVLFFFNLPAEKYHPMVGALIAGFYAMTIAAIVEYFLLGAKQIVVSHTFDLTNDNLWKMPVWVLVAVQVLVFCVFFFPKVPFTDHRTGAETTIEEEL